MSNEPWAVYEHREGVVWKVTPPTEAQAKREAVKAGLGFHEAMPLSKAKELSNAWSHGRVAGATR